VAGAGEGAALGEDVDVGVDGDDLGLGKVLIFLEVALVIGLDVALLRLAEEFVEDVGVVEVPAAAADGDEYEEDADGGEAGSAVAEEAQAGGEAVVGTADSEANGDDAEEGRDGEPVGDGPEECGDEMAVAVHVRVGVAGSVAEKVESVFPAVGLENG